MGEMPAVQAPAVLLMGGPGSGKTHSLTTILESGLELFVIITEPNGLETLLDVCLEKKISLDKVHWHVVAPRKPGLDGLSELVQKVGAGTFESLAKLPPSPGRLQGPFRQLLSTLSDFVDERTGEAYGPVDKFGSDRALVIDSLSGLNMMAWNLTVGNKPSAHPGEWGVAMNVLDQLILQLTSDLRCLFVLTGHTEREIDEVAGGSKVMVSTLGKKLAPRIPRFFSEVVLAVRNGSDYSWSTSALNVDLKRRVLPIAEKLPPTFAPIISRYRTRLAAVGGLAPNIPSPPPRPTTPTATGAKAAGTA